MTAPLQTGPVRPAVGPRLTRGALGGVRATLPPDATTTAIIWVTRDGATVERSVDQPTEVGRAVDGLLLDDPGVSARHALLVPTAEGLVVMDLGSSNGTWINGVPVTAPVVARPGDQVALGNTLITPQRLESGVDGGGRPSLLSRMTMGAGAGAPRGTFGLFDADPDVIVQRARVPLVVAPEPSDATAVATEPVPVAEPAAPDEEPEEPENPFPDYTERRRIIPVAAWFPIRALLFIAYIGLCVALWVRPDGALFAYWKVIVPVLPLVLLVAPGLWRNSCPIAATNQLPRLAGFTRGRTLPTWLRNTAFVIPVVAFAVIVPTRKVVFNTNGPATSILLLTIIGLAFLGGAVFKGKSGWCSQFCPMLPIERLYGQTPYVTLPNSHCQPCVGCTKNCYDFNPNVAYQADMLDADPEWSGPRKLFAAAFPGIIVGFFAFASYPEVSVGQVYATFFTAVVASIGAFFILDGLLRVPTALLAALSGATAISLFYWYGAPGVADTWGEITGADLSVIVWPVRVLVIGLALGWFVRTVLVRRRFIDELVAKGGVKVELSATRRLKPATPTEGGDAVRFLPDDLAVAAAPGQSLLDTAEVAGVPLEAGCRMGVCGADPITVVDGAGCLSGVTDEEAKTIRRLGLADGSRMACCARLESAGEVTVSLEVEKGGAADVPSMPVDPSIRRVVIIGNGIAGVTTADFVRRNHPQCEIHLVAREPYPLYNRMGISRVVYGRTAMQGLHLLDDGWYEENRVTTWLNTVVTAIHPAQHTVVLGTGEPLAYDRLVLATGAAANVPSYPGWGLPGSFVLREVGDAMAIRGYVQHYGVRHAVVAGAGLLGLEAAFALHELGLGVVVLDRGPRLLGKQCDERASSLLATYFAELGIRVLPNTEATEVAGADRVEGVTLSTGTTVECGVFLVAAGNRANTDLARAAGLEVNRAIVVDDHLRTSAPDVYAVGDVAEVHGRALGLWPVAAEQAEVAAVNLLGGDEAYPDPAPAAILKGVGIDMTSAGEYQEAFGDEVIAIEGPGIAYRKLVVRDGVVVGGIVLGWPDLSPHLIKAVKDRIPVEGLRDHLRSGNWDVLSKPPVPVAAAPPAG